MKALEPERDGVSANAKNAKNTEDSKKAENTVTAEDAVNAEDAVTAEKAEKRETVEEAESVGNAENSESSDGSDGPESAESPECGENSIPAESGNGESGTGADCVNGKSADGANDVTGKSTDDDGQEDADGAAGNGTDSTHRESADSANRRSKDSANQENGESQNHGESRKGGESRKNGQSLKNGQNQNNGENRASRARKKSPVGTGTAGSGADGTSGRGVAQPAATAVTKSPVSGGTARGTASAGGSTPAAVADAAPRRSAAQPACSSAAPAPAPVVDSQPPAPVGRGRRVRVRSRLIVAVAVVAAATAGASLPGLLAASGRVGDSQTLVDEAGRTQQALSLAHSLADERDEVTAYIAAGRPHGKGLSAAHSALVDRQIAELREAAPTALGHDLDRIAAVRKAALTSKSSALKAYQSYADIGLALHKIAQDLADHIPPRAGTGAHALADLDNAVQQAEATRGLLRAAFAVPGATGTTTVIDPITGLPSTVPVEPPAATKHRNELSTAAQQAHLREQASLADFHDRAPAVYRAAYDTTVTGPDVVTAEKDLVRLTDQPTLSDDDRGTDSKKFDAALTARIDMMRGAEASLNTARANQLAQLRDDDVTALEIRIALAGLCLLAAVGVVMAMSRSLTRPLAVLRLGSARLAADPAAEEPIRFTGRDDEFAQVIRSVNALHTRLLGLRDRPVRDETAPETAQGPARDGQQSAADPAGQSSQDAVDGQGQCAAGLRSALDAVADSLAGAKNGLEGAAKSVGQGTFVHLALRTLGLVERQLAVIEKLEEQEHDPDRLATLFKLDHFATVMRRHSENLLVLAGADHGQQQSGPVPLIDVVRAAGGEVERYERIRIAAVPPHAHVVGFAADDLSHLLAELMENATSFSPPDAAVEVSGWPLEDGALMLSVVDEGIGIPADRIDRFNTRLERFSPDTAQDIGGDSPADLADQDGPAGSAGAQAAGGAGDGFGLGLYVVARLAQRHGVRVRLRARQQGGVAADVVLPGQVLAEAGAGVVAPPREVRVVADASPARLPTAVTETNSSVLPARGLADSLIAAAEHALESGPQPDNESHAQPGDRTHAQPGDGSHPHAIAQSSPQAGAVRGANPYAIGPDTHDRARDDAATPAATDAPPGPAVAHEPPVEPGVPVWDRVTDKGLPKRTPRISPAAGLHASGTQAVDAQELRRRLGGFQQGAKDGYRDAAHPAPGPVPENVTAHRAPEGAVAPRIPHQAVPRPVPATAAPRPRSTPLTPHPTAPVAQRARQHEAVGAVGPSADVEGGIQGDTVEEASS